MKNIITNKIMTMVIVISFLFTLIMTGCVDDETPPKDTITPNDITWTATANDTENTTAIHFTFSASVTGLTAGDISITDGTGSITKGTLTGNETSWSLAVNVVSGGDISISINKPGIESGSKKVEVFETFQSNIPVELIGRWHMGNNEAAPFMYEFLENGDFITAAGFSGLEISADENIITILSNGNTVGSATFSIKDNEMTLSNITGTAGLVPGVHFKRDITYNITIDNTTYTTAINFEFNHSISGLTADHIKVTTGTGSATRGSLTGGETSWTAAITVATAGDIWVWIEKPGVDNNPKMVAIDNTITWIATADDAIGTTAINFEFIAPVSELIATDILITDGTGSVTKGALTGEGTSWSIAVNVKSVGNINVSISKLGIENKIEIIDVHFISWIVSTNNNKYTTAIKIEFEHPVSGLKFEQITLANGTASVIRRALIGNDTSWLQVIDVKNLGGGDISVSITKSGIENKTETVTVYKNIMVATGDGHNLVIKTDGTLRAWGRNHNGQLGDGTTEDRHTPIQIGAENDWASVYAGGNRTFAIKTNGTLWAWGMDYNGLDNVTSRHVPTQIGTDIDWSYLSIGLNHTVFIKTDGTLWACGYNINGLPTDALRVPFRIGTDTDWVFASTGGDYTIALKAGGTLWAWERNQEGHQFGTSTQIGTDTDWVSISIGNDHNVAIKTDGSLWSWGSNFYGQLGNGTTSEIWDWDEKNFPTRIGMETNWLSVSAVSNRSVAIKTDGTLWSWGNVSWYIDGNSGSGTVFTVPTQLKSGTDWISIFTGTGHFMAIKADGLLWACGNNSYSGQLGDGTTINRAEPVQVIFP